MSEDKDSGRFGAQETGFQVMLPNGVTISTQFGYGDYCANRDSPDPEPESVDAEVACFRAGGPWCTREVLAAANMDDPEDDVVGWVSVADWLLILDAARALPAEGGAS